MTDTIDRIERAEMLDAVVRQLGHALWAVQELEWTLAECSVVMRPEARGAGEAKGGQMLNAASKRRFAQLLQDLVDASFLEPTLSARISEIIAERNWIVHRSRRENRGVINSRERCAPLIARLERTCDEANSLNCEVTDNLHRFVLTHGVSQEAIDADADNLAREWGF